jgi:glycosyltransferase involved in cell wall biosynthesis
LKKVAIAHEWFVSHAGSERVVEQILAIYPDADLFSLVQFLANSEPNFLGGRSVTTSFIQQLPFARKAFRQYLPLMPFAVEQFDLSAYDLIISSNHAVAKGIISRADQLHISYVHTPIRYAWDLQWQYLQQSGLKWGIKGVLTRLILHYLRLWDVASAQRVDAFVANSHFIARRIWKTYRRKSTVIYPPVGVHRFRADRPRADFYLIVSRFVPYKRVDLAIAAFNRLGLPLLVIGSGSDQTRLQRLAGANIHFLGHQPEAALADYMERCKAFVFTAEEDFGITVVEAQAAGAPVIAYGRGGATETVLPGETGLLFSAQTVDSLVAVVEAFEKSPDQFDPWRIRQQAERFSEERFRAEFQAFVDNTWVKFEQGFALE